MNEVLVERDYPNYNLYKNDICACGSELLNICDINVWYPLLNKN